MSLFPIFEELKQEKQKEKKIKEYNINFEKKEYKGGFVYGIDAIKVWIYKTLRTKRYEYAIYSADYGEEIHNLMGKKYQENFVKTEIERLLKDCLLIHPNIRNIQNIQIEYKNRTLMLNFIVNSDFGEIDINV